MPLQAVSSTQAHRIPKDICKDRKLRNKGKLEHEHDLLWESDCYVCVGREIWKINIICLYLTESGGMSVEVAVMAMEQQPPVSVKENE